MDFPESDSNPREILNRSLVTLAIEPLGQAADHRMITRRASSFLLAIFAAHLSASVAAAHGDAEWIRRSQRFSFCCGPNDCHRVPASTVGMNGLGYVVLWRGEITVIPFQRTLPSDNEDFWLCEDPRRTVRCFFAPPLGS